MAFGETNTSQKIGKEIVMENNEKAPVTQTEEKNVVGETQPTEKNEQNGTVLIYSLTSVSE